MKKKASIKVLAAPEDLERLSAVLAHLGKNGVVTSGAKSGFGKKDIVLAVLSERFYDDEQLKSQLFDLLAAGAETILPLNLGQAPIPEDIMNLLFARNIIMSSGRTDEQLAERILSAIPEKKNYMTAVLIGAVAVILLISGIFLWRTIRAQGGEASLAEPEPIPNPLGITEEELAEIKDVVIIGDRFTYFTYDNYDEYGHWPEIGDFAYQVVDENGSHWYSTEDGQEYTVARYDDLRFLELMPNLNSVSMVLVEVDPEMLPDLTNAQKLNDVSIHDSSIQDISWLSGSAVSNLDVSGTDIEDYGPLTDCEMLHHVNVDGQGEFQGDFSEFAPPAIMELDINGMEGSTDLTALEDCRNILRLKLSNLDIENLDFLKEMKNLQDLQMFELHRLGDISAVAELPELSNLEIVACDRVRDYMPINACKKLVRISIDRRDWMDVDSAFLNDMPYLNDIGLFGLNLNNMDFLATVNQNLGLCLSFCGDIRDYSGMAQVKRYQWLHVNLSNRDFSRVAPYLQDTTIADLELYDCNNVDLSALPKVENTLILTRGYLEDLSGLNALYVRNLELRDMQYLRSLKGIENLDKLQNGIMELRIMGCIRLTDYSALDGAMLRVLRLGGMYNMPDFSRFSVKNLQLETIEDIEDLNFLETLDREATYEFSFTGMDNLKDLSMLRNFKGTNLYVPPQVADQAEELVADGNFRYYEVRYPDSGWSPMNEPITLLSLEELETLPKSILRRVGRLWIAGDEVFDPDQYEVSTEWIGNKEVVVLWDRETGQSHRVNYGPFTDFSALSALTGVWDLRLIYQPLTNLEGIQHFTQLQYFSAEFCQDLTDASALYTQQNLREIRLQGTAIDTIQGVQNLPNLCQLVISGTAVTDLSPLLELDYSAATDEGGFGLEINNCTGADLSCLSQIPAFGNLTVCGFTDDSWMDMVANAKIRCVVGPMYSDEKLQSFVQQHPELEEIHIEEGYQLTDLTPLLELENLRYAHIWNRADRAGRSLDGMERNFQLDIN